MKDNRPSAPKSWELVRRRKKSENNKSEYVVERKKCFSFSEEKKCEVLVTFL